MKKFLSVALSLVMLFTATTFNGNAVERPQKGEPQVVNTQARYGNVNLNEQKQGENKGPEKGFGASLSKAAGNVVSFVLENGVMFVVGGGAIATALVVMNAARNKKLDAAALQENWNNSNKSAAQRYFDAMKILLFGDKTRKNLQKLENKRNKQQEVVNNLKKQKETAGKEKDDANTKLSEANTAKENADNNVNFINKGGKDKEGNEVKGLDTLENNEKTAQETLANATKARKDAEKNLNTAKKEQVKVDKAVKKAEKVYKAKKAKFDEIDKTLNDKNNGAKSKLDTAKKEYKNACDNASGWKYNEETGKCEPMTACGPNFNRNEKGECVCDTEKFDLTNDRKCLVKCGENFDRGEDNKCVCSGEYELVKNKCLLKCGENQERDKKGNCGCKGDYVSVNGKCEKNECVANEVYNAATNKCDCADKYTRHDGKCELIPRCDEKTQDYKEETNTCVCKTDYVDVKGTCEKRATCKGNEVYNKDTNTCTCPTDKGFVKNANGECGCPEETILVFEGKEAKCVEKSNDDSNFQ